MKAKEKPNCLTNQKNIFRQLGAALAASKLFNDYISVIPYLSGIGPEMYAESWMKECIHGDDEEFRNLVFGYFLKMLKKLENVE